MAARRGAGDQPADRAMSDREQGTRVVPPDAPAAEPVPPDPRGDSDRLARIETRLARIANSVGSSNATLVQIEWLLRQLLATAERREARRQEPATTSALASDEIDRLGALLTPPERQRYDPLTGRYLMPRLLANIPLLAAELRRLGYPVPSVVSFRGGISYLHAWRDPTLDPLVRAVSIRIYARTAAPGIATTTELQRRVRALEGTLRDQDRVQEIWSPDDLRDTPSTIRPEYRSHHQGRRMRTT